MDKSNIEQIASGNETGARIFASGATLAQCRAALRGYPGAFVDVVIAGYVTASKRVSLVGQRCPSCGGRHADCDL